MSNWIEEFVSSAGPDRSSYQIISSDITLFDTISFHLDELWRECAPSLQKEVNSRFGRNRIPKSSGISSGTTFDLLLSFSQQI
jgi:hypothetical protein